METVFIRPKFPALPGNMVAGVLVLAAEGDSSQEFRFSAEKYVHC